MLLSATWQFWQFKGLLDQCLLGGLVDWAAVERLVQVGDEAGGGGGSKVWGYHVQWEIISKCKDVYIGS